MSVYCYSETLKNVFNQLTLDLKYKNIKIDLMDHFPFLKKVSFLYIVRLIWYLNFVHHQKIMIIYWGCHYLPMMIFIT